MNISSTNPITPPADLYPSASPAAERQRMAQAIRAVNQANIFGENRELTFSLDRSTQQMVIRVIDRDTRETVMQLPPEYVLRLAANSPKKP
jgi:uncharacterized FlaG/YvyC family protein